MESLVKRRRNYIFHDPPRFPQVSRDKIQGVPLLLQEVDKIVERRHDFPRLKQLDIDIGRGALFYGPRGTGKTYLAWYVGTAARGFARFVDLRGCPRATVDKREVDLKAEDLREIIPLGREYVRKFDRPIIFFYDEFEEIEEKVIEELRIQLCDIEKSINGIYFLLTSADPPDAIDEGLFRPGRISDLIQFSHLTPRGMREMLHYAFLDRSYDPGIDLEAVASLLEDAAGMDTPAALVKFRDDIYRVVSLEQKNGSPRAEKRHLVEQCIRRIAGQPAEETLKSEALRLVAYHEAGHVVLAYILGLDVRFSHILPELRSSENHGDTTIAHKKDGITTARTLKDMIAFQFGGMIAEELLGYRDLLTHEDDLKAMNYAAQGLVEKLALGSELKRRFGHFILNRPPHEYSDEMRRVVERDIGRVLRRARRRAWAAVRKTGEDYFKTRVERVAAALLEKKILFPNELNALLKNECHA